MKQKIGKALVVGAGIAGIRSALDLAETGYQVTLIDRAQHIGGILSRLDYQFPTDRCGMCKMLPLVDRDASSQFCLRKGLFHENIELLLSTELSSIEGEAGSYRAVLRQEPNLVNTALCIGCGECAKVCPVEVPDDFNTGFTTRKAIYLPVPHNIPNTYTIDLNACTSCGECVNVCPTGAIDLLMEARKQFRILVVDDELIVRDSLKEWLVEEKFSVDMAASGQEALDLLAENPYRLMLLDIKMPGMDGVEVLKRAKDAQPDLTVVMMTAYATVETAVEAMKIGALDYLIKPFDPEALIPKIVNIYNEIEVSEGKEIEVGAVVLSCGVDYFDPTKGTNTYNYKKLNNVVTSIEFERILSGTGPTGGLPMNPVTGKPLKRIAWIQCVGSRDLQTNADFCSNICCMYAIKEALMAKEKAMRIDEDVETTIFYMDMRTFGKSFQQYRDDAESKHGVSFEKSRVHSVTRDDATGDLVLRYADISGKLHEKRTDMVVLSVGQRPAGKTDQIAEMLELDKNAFGFLKTDPLFSVETNKKGIVVGGSCGGLMDIADSVVSASAAALSASKTIHAAGGGLAPEVASEPIPEADLREPPRIMAMICSDCEKLSGHIQTDRLKERLSIDPAVVGVRFIDQCCTGQGWNEVLEQVEGGKPNRLLIGACMPYVYIPKFKELAKKAGLSPACIDVVDIRTPAFFGEIESSSGNGDYMTQVAANILGMGLARLKRVNPEPTDAVKIYQNALVIGGGIAGMTAALSMADHGFPVDLIESSDVLGGNLSWLTKTLEGREFAPLLDEYRTKIEKHPNINLHLQSKVVGSAGETGRFHSTIAGEEGKVINLRHGVAVIATGGNEATTSSYGYGQSESIVTQKELENKLTGGEIDPNNLTAVAMIQCVDSREEPRNYCSRICCASTIKHALEFKKTNPDMNVYVLYRDMMTYGFNEAWFTQARKAGVIFIPYRKDRKPEVKVSDDGSVVVNVFEPIIGQPVELDIDLLILATGVVPNLPKELAESFGAEQDAYGFFKEADSKWRPVDSLKEGVFACGFAHSPRNVSESILTAQAAAQRALRILTQEELPSGKVVAKVRHAICSMCERCIEACPYGARFIDAELEQVAVNQLICQGCGACASICPNDASYIEGFMAEQMFEIIDAAIG